MLIRVHILLPIYFVYSISEINDKLVVTWNEVFEFVTLDHQLISSN